ncbi:MAG TPA: hypothetical protein VGC51_09315 [Hansschlegelia sp.]
MGLIWEISFAEFTFVTLILGGGAAWMAGRGVASSWEPSWKAALWMIPLGLAVRFIHYALFSGSLLTLHFFVVDLVILVGFTLAGHRATMARQMTRQYSWLYERAGPFAWRARSGAGAR